MLDLPVGELAHMPILSLEAVLAGQANSGAGFAIVPMPVLLASSTGSTAMTEAARLAPLFLPPILGEGQGEMAPGTAPRLYQVEAAEHLASSNSFLLADDAGTGKSASASLAMASLFRRREAHRALVVCPKPWRRHWVEEIRLQGPGLLVQVIRGDRRSRDRLWRSQAHILIADYQTLAEDVARGALTDEGLRFDILLMDQLPAVSRRSTLVADGLSRIEAARRWGTAGALPQESADWRAIFHLLDPAAVDLEEEIGLPRLRERFLPFVLRRRKSELAPQMPALTRQEVWLDLDEGQAGAYREALADERYRLGRLGESATLTHVRAAFDRLQQICAFAPESLDGPKVRALLDLVEEITPAGGKLIVFSQHPDAVHDRLRPILEAYGAVRLEAAAAEAEQDRAWETFRGLPDRRILLADIAAARMGPLPAEVSFIVHFDHEWNPLGRGRLEARLFPDRRPRLPTTVYEFWMAETVDETLHSLLAERDMVSPESGVDAEGSVTLEDWMDRVLEIPRQKQVRRTAAETPEGTAFLPGTNVLRTQLAGLPPEKLLAGVEMFFRALGYTEARLLRSITEEGGDLAVARISGGSTERLLVRCLRASRNVGVGEGRSLLRDLESQPDYAAACLVVTTDFTDSMRKLADGAEGRLSLVSGAELYRHLHILGWL